MRIIIYSTPQILWQITSTFIPICKHITSISMKNLYLFSIVLCLLANHVSAQQIYFKATASNGIITALASTSKDYTNYSELSSSQLGFSAEPSSGPGGTRPGQPVFDKIVITKNSDIATTKLMPYLTNGNAIRDVEIVTTRRDDNGGMLPTYKIELKDVFITDISTSSTNECACFSESYEMKYNAIRITTYSTDNKGKTVENPVKFMWDIEKNKADF